MVRNALIGFLLVPFIASSAAASRIDVERTPAHASGSKSTVHRAHHTAHPVSHSPKTTPRTTPRTAHNATRRSASRSNSHHSTRYSAAGRHTTYSSRQRSGLHRARLSHRTARFTPLATVPLSSRDTRPRLESDTASTDLLPDTASPALENSAPAEADSAPAASADLAQDKGNPLTAPTAAGRAVESTSGQVAELHLPRYPENPHVPSYALRGTHDSLVRQNERSEEEALERIEDDADLQDRIARGFLVRVPESPALAVNQALPEDRRYCRPWTADFLTDLSRAHQVEFRKPLVVSSAVRTVEYQKRLMRINHNAADAEGDIVSPHVTGATIDIAKSGLSKREMQWMRAELLAYQNAGFIDVEEEFRQRCFHITVYRNYVSATQPRRPASAMTAPSAPPAIPAGMSDTASKDE